jgi:hypothetical protein
MIVFVWFGDIEWQECAYFLFGTDYVLKNNVYVAVKTNSRSLRIVD